MENIHRYSVVVSFEGKDVFTGKPKTYRPGEEIFIKIGFYDTLPDWLQDAINRKDVVKA